MRIWVRYVLGSVAFAVAAKQRAESNRPPERGAFGPQEAPTFRCPSCGAPAAKDARACVHCGSLLATKRCVTCFALSPREAERCVKCGALLPAPAFVADGAGRCPDCRLDLVAHAFGAVGYSQVEVLLWPPTLAALEAMAPVVELLDAG